MKPNKITVNICKKKRKQKKKDKNFHELSLANNKSYILNLSF